jgi:pre-rRNA-processing protein TSR1
MCFSPLASLEHCLDQLMATGSLLSINPDRIIVKKIVLTGNIIKIHKKRAIVKDMFYNPGKK